MDMLQSKNTAAVIIALVLGVAPTATLAEEPKGGVVIDVTAKKSAYPIAIPVSPLGDQGIAKEIAAVASFDMTVAGGMFKVIDPAGYLADLKAEGINVVAQKWKDIGAFGVVKYRITATEIEFRFYEVLKSDKAALTKSYSRKDNPRKIAHRWCNDLYKFLTQEAGFFGSRIVFTAKGKGSSKIIAMDFDGAAAGAISNNSSTNILPAFSPGGQIAYTSFMRNNPDLYVTGGGGGRPKKLSGQPGMNTGAAWSPDGGRFALTLSMDGNPVI
jgi:TolB protein